MNFTVNGLKDYPSVYDIIMPLDVAWAIERFERNGVTTEINGDSITVWKAGGRS